MKRKIRALIGIILTLTLLLSSLPLTALAQTTEEEDIYYSDILFSYSKYLANTPILASFSNETQACFAKMKGDFMESPYYTLMAVKEGMQSLNLKDYFEAVSDAVAGTDYTYNAALDKANILFAQKLLEAESSLYERAGTMSKWTKKFNLILTIYDEMKVYIDLTPKPTTEEVIDKLYTVTWQKGLFSNFSTNDLIPLFEKLNYALPTILKMAEIGGDLLSAIKTLLVAFMIEDMRLGAISDILSVADSGAVYDGMSRLSYQLRDGFSSYFIDTYVDETLLPKLIKEAEKIVAGKFLGNLGTTFTIVSTISSVAAFVVFDLIIDVPDLDELTSQMVLAQYSKEFYSLVVNKANSLSNGMNYENIRILETLFSSLAASTDTAFEASKALIYENEPYYNTYNNKYNGYNIFEKSLMKTEEELLKIPKEQRIRSDYDFVAIYSPYSLSDKPSDFIEEGVFYCTDGIFNGSVYVNSVLTCPEDTEITVLGNINVNIYHTLIVDGKLNITGDLTLNAGSYTNDISKLTMTLPDSQLTLGGDFLSEKHTCCNLTNGTIVFAGNEVQKIDYLNGYNITVLNHAGIRYGLSSTYLRGHFDLNGNPLNQSYHYTVIAANTASFDPDSNFGNVNVGCDYTFNCNITANIYSYSYDITVPENSEITINGSLWIDYPNQLTIDGRLTVTKNLTLNAGSYTNDISKLNMTLPDSQLTLGGDFLSEKHTCCNLTNGTIVFAGNEVQKIDYLNGYNITVLNHAGIRYGLSSTYLRGHFDLNGNPLDQSYHYTVIAANTASFDPDSNFGNVNVGCDYTFNCNITANIYSYSYDITVPENSEITINGSLWIDYPNQLTIDGKLTVTKNLTLEAGSYSSDISKVNLTNTDSVLAIGGNFAADKLRCCNLTNGKVILCGEALQSTRYLTVGTLILENQSNEGVILYDTYISNLFLHNGNNFTYSSASFPDYDGDGLQDNVDPEPIVGNPCTITVKANDDECGSVSETELDTIGGTIHTITATPSGKYNFVKWVNASGAAVSYDSEYTFVAKGDDTLTAVFEKRKHSITVNTQGGTITAPSVGVIESQIDVCYTENEGYIFTEGSLCYNGIPIENGAFIMPDEDVTITAEFVYNPHYFALKEKLALAKTYTYQNYSAESFAALQSAISSADSVLENHITETVSDEHISVLQTAIDSLADKYIVSLSVFSVPVIYIGMKSTINETILLIAYDNSTTEYTGNFTVENFDCMQAGLQTVTFIYGDFSVETEIEVISRSITEVICTPIPDQIYSGAGTTSTPELEITFPETGETLVRGIDYTVMYRNNSAPGRAVAIITGMGCYEGSRVAHFNIYCEHDFEITEYTPPTLTENGYCAKKCTICGTSSEEIVEKLKVGDADSNGEINALDLAQMKIVILYYSADYESYATCDTNGDGVINILDLIRLKKYLAGESVLLG